jgi:hypothetical protein
MEPREACMADGKNLARAQSIRIRLKRAGNPDFAAVKLGLSATSAPVPIVKGRQCGYNLSRNNSKVKQRLSRGVPRILLTHSGTRSFFRSAKRNFEARVWTAHTCSSSAVSRNARREFSSLNERATRFGTKRSPDSHDPFALPVSQTYRYSRGQEGEQGQRILAT